MIFFSFLARNGSQMVKNHLVNIQWTIRSHLWPFLAYFRIFNFWKFVIAVLTINILKISQFWVNFHEFSCFLNKSWCFLLQKSINDALSPWNSSKLTQKVRFLTFIAFMIINFLKIFNFLANFYEFSVIHLLILD